MVALQSNIEHNPENQKPTDKNKKAKTFIPNISI